MLKDILLKNSSQIINWIQYKNSCIENSLPILYSSIDVRQSKFKLAPVDINLFPGGFNNFASDIYFHRLQKALQEKLPKDVKNIALVVENFTRNQKYLDNVRVLQDALLAINLFVVVLTIDNLQLIDVQNSHPISLDSFDYIILNNDLSGGIPPELINLQHKIAPSPLYGWYQRRKDILLRLYNALIEEMFIELNLNIDPWYMSTFVERCDGLNFKTKLGLDILADKVDSMLININLKYKKYNIDYEPHVFIKANNGTFGMGVMRASTAADVLNINKKDRHSMSVLKQGLLNSDVVIQEGIETTISFNNMPAERVLYTIGDVCIGGLIRYNEKKSNQDSLNSSGMQFEITNDLDILDVIMSALCNLTVKLEGIELKKCLK